MENARLEKLKKIKLPDYTKGEEIFNMVTHIVGGAIGIVATILCVCFAIMHGNSYGVLGGSVFGASMIILFTISSVYHGLSKNCIAKPIFRVLDHCTIYVLIAGTYTPIALGPLREYSHKLGWTIFAFIWIMAAIGILFNAIDLEKFKVLSMICYIFMGWCIVFAWGPTKIALGRGGTALLLAGGIAYTIGAVLYVLGKKCRYIHSVFHIFVDIGSLLHFLCILLYVI